jgi:hypothetical protein
MDISSLLKLAMPILTLILEKFFGDQSQNSTAYNAISNPTKQETENFVHKFNEGFANLKVSDPDGWNFLKLDGLPTVTDSDSAASAARFLDALKPSDPGAGTTFSLTSDALFKASSSM